MKKFFNVILNAVKAFLATAYLGVIEPIFTLPYRAVTGKMTTFNKMVGGVILSLTVLMILLVWAPASATVIAVSQLCLCATAAQLLYYATKTGMKCFDLYQSYDLVV